MVATKAKLATFEDLAALDSDVRAELIRGVIVERTSPSAEHGSAQFAFGTVLGRRFHRPPSERWPGGWWFISEAEVEYEAHEVFVQDVAGWRRDRVPERPSGRPARVFPDWVCELTSPSNEKRDTIEKFQTLHASKVPHYWIANPIEQTLIVYRWQETGYLAVLTASAGDVVRAEPFEAVELRVATLFGTEPDED